MNKYKQVEELLKNYTMMQASIENMQDEIEYIKKEDGMTGISYDRVSTSPTYSFSSSVEDTALSKSEKIHYLELQMEGVKRQLERIDRAMKGLTETERIIIEEKYIKGRQWWQVGYKANCSESTGKRHRRNAINKLIIGLYGEKED